VNASGLPSVSVVVPVRNVAGMIGAQMSALSGQTYEGNWELIVVDNGSSDGTRKVIDEGDWAIPQLRVIDAADAVGVSAVRNRGITEARGELLLFCDGDDVVDGGWIAAMVRALERHDAAAGTVRVENINPAAAQVWRPQGSQVHLQRWPGFLAWGSSANLGVRAEVLREVGGFDETIPGNCGEDVDLCWRIQLAGHTLGFAAEAIVDYRLRTDSWHTLEQAHRYAISEVFLYRRYRRRGMSRRALPDAARAWLRGATDLVTARSQADRVRALRILVKNVARIRASVRFRVFYP
jgi:glycosyltransferase involved in cell wall biosynthesis